MRLPPPRTDGAVAVALAQRRTRRSFDQNEPVTVAQLAQLLWAAQGITSDGGKRTAPSAGSQYPLHVLVVVGAVTEVDQGLFGYQPDTHSLTLIAEGDHRGRLEQAAIDDQPWVGEAPLVLALVAEMSGIVEHFRSQPPEGERGRRYAQIETGAVAQNVQLQATALGLGCVIVAGFDDAAVSATLQLTDGREPTTLIAIGRPHA